MNFNTGITCSPSPWVSSAVSSSPAVSVPSAPDDTDAYTPSDEEIFDDVPAPTSTDNTHATSSVTNTSSPQLQRPTGFHNLSLTLMGEIGTQLSDARSYTQTNRAIRQAMKLQHWQRLTSECRAKYSKENPDTNPHGNPGKLYADPINRQDQFVPSNTAGLKYLAGIGITHPFLINQIKKGLPIETAIHTVQTNRQKIELARQSDDLDIINALDNPTIYYCVECGLLAPDRISMMSTFGRSALEQSPAVRYYLDQGELSMQEVETMTLDAQDAFESPSVSKYLKENKLSVKDVLSMTWSIVNAFENPFICECLTKNKLLIQDVLSMPLYVVDAFDQPLLQLYLNQHRVSMKDALSAADGASSALQNPAVFRYLAQGELSIKDVLSMTFSVPEALGNPLVQQYLEAGELSMKDVLNITLSAAMSFSNSLVKKLLQENKLTLKQVLAISQNAWLFFAKFRPSYQPAQGELWIEKILGIDESTWGLISQEKLAVKDFIKPTQRT